MLLLMLLLLLLLMLMMLLLLLLMLMLLLLMLMLLLQRVVLFQEQKIDFCARYRMTASFAACVHRPQHCHARPRILAAESQLFEWVNARDRNCLHGRG